ncbi:hypothetical protein GCM10025858_07090 [Alicyclobacillus sacchari]|nr:hypothetical protein GCM10025858_07090 [Alicyclobacillus sacchari]
MEIQRPRGTVDLLPGEVEVWQALESAVRDVLDRANYGEIRTPIFEHTELFERGVGETTDIVSKEMYTFLDRGNRSVTLRPEGTAGAVRAFVENKLYGKAHWRSCTISARCFAMRNRRKGGFGSFINTARKCLGRNCQPSMPRLSRSVSPYYNGLVSNN